MSTFAEQAIQDLESSIAYATNEREEWSNAWKLYNGERVNRGYIGIADTFDPMCFTTVETKLANVFGNKPRVVYWPKVKEQYGETRILTKLFDHTWDINRLSSEILPFGRSTFITGNATLWADWDSELDNDGWIKVRHIPINDNIVDPTSNSPYNDGYGGYRYLTTISELRDMKIYDAAANEWTGRYKNLKDVKLWTGGEDEETDQLLKDQLDGAVVDGNAKKELVEVTVLYYVKGPHKGKKIELANRNVSIFEDDSPYQRKATKKTVRIPQYDPMGDYMKDQEGNPVFEQKEVTLPEIKPFIPRAFQRCYTDGARRFGRGEIYYISDLQELLNDTINQRRDNATLQINQRSFVDPKFKDQMKRLKNLPGSTYAIPPGAITWEVKPDTAKYADVEIARIKDQIRTTTAIDEVTAGLNKPGQSTATEINTQVNQAGQRFGITLQALENESYTDLADITFKMIQLFVDQERIIRLTGRQGVEWLEYNPDLYWGEYEPSVMLEQNAKAQNADEIKRIQMAGQFLINNPYADQKELTKVILNRTFQFDDDEAEQLLVKNMPDQQQMAAQGAATLASGQVAANPGQMPQKEEAQKPDLQQRLIETINFADLPEDAKAQMLAQQGLQTQMASPIQQKINIEAHKLQQGQVGHELNAHQIQLQHALDLHNTIMDSHHKATEQAMSAQAQEHSQGMAEQQQELAAQAAATPTAAK